MIIYTYPLSTTQTGDIDRVALEAEINTFFAVVKVIYITVNSEIVIALDQAINEPDLLALVQAHDSLGLSSLDFECCHMLEASGGSQSMDINTSDTDFFFEANGNLEVTGYSLFIQDPGTTDATDFGAIGGLANGLRLFYTANNKEFEVFNIQNNMQMSLFFRDHSLVGTSNEEAAGFFDSQDTFIGHRKLGKDEAVKLRSGDRFTATVRDNLSGISFLRMAVHIRRIM